MKKAIFLAGVAAIAVGSTSAYAQSQVTESEAVDNNVIIVTAQRQNQSLQDVPVAVSAFDSRALEAQQIDNASDLQLTLPNVTFTAGNFDGASFTIRGVGDLCVGDTCDSATGIHLNGSPLFGTRLFEAEYFDLERIEVLRGPQGTLFGRNATSGVVNIVTAKPKLGRFEGAIEGEYGNYDSYKVKGMINIPIGDTLAVRAAGFYLNRDGYTRNLFDGSRIDGRDIYSVRGSVKWEPTPDTTVEFMASYLREEDDRLRIQKQLCQRDPTGVLGCLNNRRDSGKVNTNATFNGVLGSSEFFQINGIPGAFGLNSLYGPDGHSNAVEPDDVRAVNTDFTPEFFTEELQLQAHVEHNFGPIKLAVTGTYQDISFDASQDYNLSVVDQATYGTALATLEAAGAGLVPGLPSAYFSPISNALIPNGAAGGTLCTSSADQTGFGAFGGNSICAGTPIVLDRSVQEDKSWSIEGIISSDFDGPFNFLLGGIYADIETTNSDYFVNAFSIDYIAGILGAFNTFPTTLDADPANDLPPSYLGTPFFRTTTQSFGLKSYGIFGETYVDLADNVNLTLGLRYSNDKKSVVARSTLLAFLVPFGQTGDVFDSLFVAGFDADPGIAGNQAFQRRTQTFDAFTGRAVLNWEVSPDNLLYASYSRGYKSGGINPPLQSLFDVPEAFGKEIVDSFEIGSKNSFANGALQLNATAFFYKYKDLQLNRIVARTSVNDNVDAEIYGVEIETVVRPDPDWMINLGFSWLHSKVSEDLFLANQRDPSGANPNSVIVKDITEAFNCAVVANQGGAAAAEAFVTGVNGGLGLQGLTPFPSDSGLGAATGAFSICSVLEGAAAGTGGAISVVNSGVPVNIRGNKLPQAPNVKFSAGVQYTHHFANDFTLVPRVDLSYTGDSFGNIFNGQVNKIEGYAQANAQLQLNGPDDGWFVRAFVQNIFDNNATTGLYLTDQSSGLFTNVFTLEPRRYGLAAGVKF